MKHGNDRAGAGGLAGIFILFIVCGVFIAFLGPVVDRLGATSNDMVSQPGLPVSQDRIETVALLRVAFSVIGIMILLAAGINYWIVSVRTQNQEV